MGDSCHAMGGYATSLTLRVVASRYDRCWDGDMHTAFLGDTSTDSSRSLPPDASLETDSTEMLRPRCGKTTMAHQLRMAHGVRSQHNNTTDRVTATRTQLHVRQVDVMCGEPFAK